MSTYFFSPSPTFGISEHSFATFQDAFTADELDQIVSYGDSLRFSSATVDNNREPGADIRVAKTAWISNNETVPWLYDRMAWVARQLNGQFYHFNLSGFQEDMQYTTYESEENGHYNWHIDAGGEGRPPRKMSLVLQLSDPADYDDGELQVMTSSNPTSVTKQRGLIAAFPSYVLHRVTPVTCGIRKSLVIWVTGPAFT
jgi:PKHD-type hydroxylase